MLLAIFIAFLGLMLHLQIANEPDNVAKTHRLPDTDAYTRTMTVERLYDTGDWYNNVLPNLNAPYGLSIHWTRPLDILILLPAWAASKISGVDVHEAIFWTGALISPLLHVLSALLAAWAARSLWPGTEAWFASIAVLANPALLGYGSFGRADHHILVLVAAICGIGTALRAILEPKDTKNAYLCGLALGLGIWVSPEVLLTAGPLLVSFGCAWWLLKSYAGKEAARQGFRISLAMLVAITLAIATERPPAQWLVGEYDKVSVQHLLIALLAAAVFGILSVVPPLNRGFKLAVGVMATTLAAIALLAVYPRALLSSEAAADSSVTDLFLPYVIELAPLHATASGAGDLLRFAGGAVSLLLVPMLLGGRRWPAGLLILLVFVPAVLATFLHRRFTVELAAVTSITGAGVVWFAVNRWQTKSAVLRASILGAALTMAIGVPFVGLMFPVGDAVQAEANSCDWNGVGEWLATSRLPPTGGEALPPILLTDTPDITPELAYRTPYRFIVSPYHRAGSAFQDTFDILTATKDDAVRVVLARRRVGYLLLCVGHRAINLGPEIEGSFEARLRARSYPHWLEPIDLPSPLASAFRLFKVR